MFRNRYIKRKVDTSDARACFICYKPTTSVMVNETPNADFFYICDSHLTDPGFARLDPEYELALKKSEAEQAEIDQLKAEWDAKKQKQAQKNSKKDDSKDDKDSKEKGSSASSTNSVSPPPPPPKTPIGRPTYELNKGVFKLRLGNKRQKMQEKKTKSLLEMPGAFPSAPTHKPK